MYYIFILCRTLQSLGIFIMMKTRLDQFLFELLPFSCQACCQTSTRYITFHRVHCKVIIGRNPIEANANTVAIQLPGNPVAYIGKCFTPYQEFLQPLQVNYHLLANYPQKLKQFPVQAKGFADRSVKYLYYTYNLPIYIYSV